MSGKSLLSGGVVCSILLLAAPPGPASDPEGPGQPTKDKQGKSDGKKKKDLGAMIDALANRNKAPKIVKDDTFRLPVFPAEYDWKENERVRSALGKVAEERTPEMWEKLVRGMDDERYCLTLKEMNDRFYARNARVGFYCAVLAAEWLFGVCNQHLPADPDRPEFPLRLWVGPKGDWKEPPRPTAPPQNPRRRPENRCDRGRAVGDEPTALPRGFALESQEKEMAWATEYITKLRKGETVQFRPRGGSMRGKIEPGQFCTVVPTPEELRVGDIVLCKVKT